MFGSCPWQVLVCSINKVLHVFASVHYRWTLYGILSILEVQWPRLAFCAMILSPFWRPGLAGTRMSQIWILLELRMMEVVVTTGAIRRAKLQSKCHHQQTSIQFLQAGWPSCRLANSVKALEGNFNGMVVLWITVSCYAVITLQLQLYAQMSVTVMLQLADP